MSESLNLTSEKTGCHGPEEAVCAQLTASIVDLREAVLALKPTGPSGFEGLLAKVLTKICGQDFRLAKSGLQNGKDGETLATAGTHISFEAKLYNSNLKDNDVLSKITRLINSSAPPDVWILGATIGVSTQLLEVMQDAVIETGIGLLVLDWPDAAIVPPLAAVCAFAQEETCAFLRDNVDDTDCVQKAEAACAAIQKSEAFRVTACPLIKELRCPSLADANARKANAKWHQASFADQALARARFGQVLAPNAKGPLPLRQRSILVQKVHQHLTPTPPPKIVALVGGEGHGKSWLAAKSWLELGDRPILIMIAAADLKSAATFEDFTPKLISKLIQQTGEFESDISRSRWKRRLKQWSGQPNEASPRFILCVDGLNQQPDNDWPRWLDGVATVIQEIGGSLIITVRESYFEERICNAVHSKIATVHVPEWSETDLRKILAAKGNADSKIKPTVLARLRNPRILNIAFDLFERGVIHDFNELSVDRLLFEHIRTGASDGNATERPDQFSKRLAQHAQEIIDRVKQQNLEDKLIFERADRQEGYTLSDDLIAVTSEQFFRPRPEDSTLYELADDGLSLALGLSIIKTLQKAERNSRDVADALDELMEPIAALDKTADAVFSAVMASSVDKQCSLAIRCALICGFLRLQNIDAQDFPAFVSVVRHSADAAMGALFGLSTTTFRHAANKDWLSMALRDCRDKPECWHIICARVSDWLRSYSLDRKAGIMRFPEEEYTDEIAKETEEMSVEIQKKMATLSARERTFLEKNMLECADNVPSLLWEEAFELLAGMPLAGFARDLVACSFSMALNSNVWAPKDKYLALIQFNKNDWQKTRQKLLEASDFFSHDDTSRTGRWALVAILRGTSTVEDAEREAVLVEALTRDREKFVGWRLVENYCASDPCDPDATEPENIKDTIEQYAQINVDEVSRGRGKSEEDHFVKDALPGVVRFRPKVAIETQRKIARSIVEREAPQLMLGITSLERHCALLEPVTVCKLLETAKALSSPREAGSRESRNNWVASQYAIQIAFPHLNGDDQIDVLAGLPSHGPPLVKLAEVLKSAKPEKLELALDQAMSSGEHTRALSALLFARYSGTNITSRSRILIGQFAEHERSSVRAEAMNIIARLKDADLIKRIVATGWDANSPDLQENHFEIWYGSLMVISAAKQGMISIDEAFDRIAPSLYSAAAESLERACHATISERLTTAARRALDITPPFSPPVVEQNIDAARLAEPPLYSLTEPKVFTDPEALIKRMIETPDDVEARRRQKMDSFNRFGITLAKEKAQFIVENVGFEAINACFSESPDDCIRYANDLLRIDESKLANIQNFALMLATSISHDNPTLARKLFGRLSGRRTFVNLVSGLSGVPLEATCVWKSANGDAIDGLRTHRLDHAVNDHQLAQEVLAALTAGQTKFLEEYARENLSSPIPVANARALMVIGFGAESGASEERLKKYLNADGLIGQVAKSARFAYDRNSWARYWFEKMNTTDSANDFWAHSVLFLKIVDGRFDLWEEQVSQAGTGTAMPKFSSSIRTTLENRVKTWKSKREKTLFGEKAPGDVYIVSD